MQSSFAQLSVGESRKLTASSSLFLVEVNRFKFPLCCCCLGDRKGIRSVNNSSAVAEMGDRLATTDMGRKVGEGAAVSLSVGELAGSASNTMSPGPRPTSTSSGILIHPTV